MPRCNADQVMADRSRKLLLVQRSWLNTYYVTGNIWRTGAHQWQTATEPHILGSLHHSYLSQVYIFIFRPPLKAIATDNWGFHFIYNSHMSDIDHLEIYLLSQRDSWQCWPTLPAMLATKRWPIWATWASLGPSSIHSFSHSFNKHTLTYCVPGIIAGTEDTKFRFKKLILLTVVKETHMC